MKIRAEDKSVSGFAVARTLFRRGCIEKCWISMSSHFALVPPATSWNMSPTSMLGKSSGTERKESEASTQQEHVEILTLSAVFAVAGKRS